MSLPASVRETLGKKYKASTINGINTYIKRLFALADIHEFDPKLFAEPKQVAELIGRISNQASRKAMAFYVVAVVTALGMDSSPFLSIAKAVTKDIGDDLKYKAPKESEKEALIKWSEVVKRRDKINVKDARSATDKLLLCLYTYLPPLRGQEYAICVLWSKKKPAGVLETILSVNNVADLDDKRFIMVHSKTEHAYGTRRIKMPDEIYDAILERQKYLESKWLLTKPNGTPMSTMYMQQTLYRIFGRKISTSMLRKMFISEIVPSLGVAERKALARIMGHSLEMQEFTYRRF